MKFIKALFSLKSILIIISFTLIITSCSEDQEKETENNKKEVVVPPPVIKKEEPKPKTHSSDEYIEEKVDLGLSKDDMKNLMLQETYPMGTNFKKIHDDMNIKGIRPEGGSDELAAQGLTESNTKMNLAGKSANLEFNFKNDSLYSFYYSITENDFNKAEKYYKGLKQFYISKLGPCKEPVAEEENRTTKSCIWGEKQPYASMTYDLNKGTITWGFQNIKP